MVTRVPRLCRAVPSQGDLAATDGDGAAAAQVPAVVRRQRRRACADDRRGEAVEERGAGGGGRRRRVALVGRQGAPLVEHAVGRARARTAIARPGRGASARHDFALCARRSGKIREDARTSTDWTDWTDRRQRTSIPVSKGTVLTWPRRISTGRGLFEGLDAAQRDRKLRDRSVEEKESR